MDVRNPFIRLRPIILWGKDMVHSASGSPGTFAHVVQSIPDYSEIIIVILILVLLWMSYDEIVSFMSLVRDAFIYRGGF